MHGGTCHEEKQAYGQQSCVANEPRRKYTLDLMCRKRLEDQHYDIARVCIIACVFKHSAVVPATVQSESDPAHGVIDAFVEMLKPPQIIYIDRGRCIRHSVICQTYLWGEPYHRSVHACRHATLCWTSGPNLDNNVPNWSSLYF